MITIRPFEPTDEEYARIETTVAPEVLERVLDWLAARFLD